MFIKEVLLALLNFVVPYLWNRCKAHQWIVHNNVMLENGRSVRLKICLKCGKRLVDP
jgi:hypothetical protein